MKKIVTISLCLLSVGFLSALTLGTLFPASAKDVSIKVPSTIQAKSGVENPLPIQVGPRERIPPKAMVVIQGIPTSASLTDGRLFPSGIWVLKPSSLSEVRLMVSSSTEVETGLTISVISLEGERLSTAATRLVISPDESVSNGPRDTLPAVAISNDKDDPARNAAPPLEPGKPSLDAPGQITGSTAPDENLEKLLKVMERGDRYLADGKIEFARRFYQLAAEMGSAQGAEAMARTYDPDYLSRFPIVGGIVPDKAMAQEWYDRAEKIRRGFETGQAGQAGRN